MAFPGRLGVYRWHGDEIVAVNKAVGVGGCHRCHPWDHTCSAPLPSGHCAAKPQVIINKPQRLMLMSRRCVSFTAFGID